MAEIVVSLKDMEEIVRSARELIENNPETYTESVEVSLKGRGKKFGDSDFISVVVIPSKPAYLPENVYKNF